MKMFTIPVDLLDGTRIAVNVVAPDQERATIVAMKSHGPSPLAGDVHDFLSTTEYAALLPQDVLDVLMRAIETQGPLPLYALKQVKWALKEANRVEAKALRDESAAEQVLKNLPASERNLVRS